MISLVLVLNGRLGNNLFQLSYIFYIKQRRPDITVYYPAIPSLGIEESPNYRELSESQPDFRISNNELIGDEFFVLLDEQFDYIIHMSGWGMSPEIYSGSRMYLKSIIDQTQQKKDFEEIQTTKSLVFHIRGGDIWQNNRLKPQKYIHPEYSALPASYFETILNESKGEAEFVVENSVPKWYLRILRKKLGIRISRSNSSAVEDLLKISKAQEVALGVSTFSWMGAFIGNPELVHIPKLGLFDRNRRPDLDFYNPSWNVKIYAFEEHNWTGNANDREWLTYSNCNHIEFPK